MREEFEYLSDEQLQNLIGECENGNMVSTPSGFSERVLQMVDELDHVENSDDVNKSEEQASTKQTSNQPIVISFEQKLKEYKRFRLQVSVAVAAAILFLVVSPFISIEGLGMDQSRTTISEIGKSRVLTEALGQHNIDKKLSEKDLFNVTEDK